MNTQDMKILASDFMSHPLSRSISDCERIGEALFDAATEIELLSNRPNSPINNDIWLLIHNLRTIGTHHCDTSVGIEAADMIEYLRAELLELRKAEQIAIGERDGADALHEAEKQMHARTKARLDDLESAGHRMALDLECLLMDCKDTAVTAKWFDSGMNSVSEWRDLFEYSGPRLENA